GEVVPAWQRLGATNIGGIARPDRPRVVVAADAAGRAPEQQHRAGDLAAGLEISLVHGKVDAHRRPVILADGVDGRGVTEAAHVFGERLLAEEAQALLGLPKLLTDEPVGIE